jgi:PST family polysaccharide transporter
MEAQENTAPDVAGGLQQAIVTGAFWTSLDRWGSRVLRLAVLAVLARLLDPRDFGLVAVAAVCVDYLSTYVAQGLGLAVIQREKLEPGHLDAMFCINLAFSILLTALLWMFSPFVARWLEAPEATAVLRWLSLSLVLLALGQVHMALLSREMRFGSVAAVNLSSSVLGGAVGIVLAVMGWGVWSLVAQQLTAGVSARLLLWWFSDWRPRFRFQLRHVRDLYGFSLFVFADQQLLFIAQRLDEALVAGYLGVTELGLYTIAKRLVLVVQELFEAPLGQVLTPAFSRVQHSIETMMDYAQKILRAAATVAVPAFLGLFALAPEALQVLFGEQWLEAATSARLLALGGPPFLLGLMVYPVLLATGRPGVLLWLNGLSAFLGVVLLLFGVRYGAAGVAGALTIRQVVTAGVSLTIAGRLFRPNVQPLAFLRTMLTPVALAAGAAAAARAAADALSVQPLWLSLGAAVLAGVLVVSLGLLWLEPELTGRCATYARRRWDQRVHSSST